MKMKKKLFVFLPAVFFLFLSFPLFAQKRVVDNAGLLSGSEISQLESLAAQIASTYDFDLVIVSETNIGSASPMDYADDYFDYNGYGLGKDRDGCLFLQVTESRDYWFSTSGRGIKILNSYAFNKLESDAVDFLRKDDPAGAYRTFIADWEMFLALEAGGRNFNFVTENAIYFYFGAWLVSLIIALAAVGIMKAKLNAVHPKTEADSFIIPGSLAFSLKQDSFLYSTVSKTERSDSSSSGGGSGSHTSSSGRSHGGGGGRY
jgi:uncharacterized protein